MWLGNLGGFLRSLVSDFGSFLGFRVREFRGSRGQGGCGPGCLGFSGFRVEDSAGFRVYGMGAPHEFFLGHRGIGCRV